MQTEIEPLERLFRSIADGEERALHSLYRREVDWVYRIAFRLIGEPSAAEDVVQETFLKIWRMASRYNPSAGSARAWIAVIARNTAFDHVRKRRSTEMLIEDDPRFIVDPADPPDPKLHRCLSGLPVDQAHAIVTMYRLGLTHVELAERLGVPIGTAKSRILRGTEALRKCMLDGEAATRHASEQADRSVMANTANGQRS